ncbi:MAG: transposase [Pseudomonadales bacterium]|nr:transposase [Pseudomonadales bacterium]
MVTYTLPYELRLAVKRRPKAFYLLFECATVTLKEFVRNDVQLGGDAGMTAVMHTHTRRLDYHPHLHIVIPEVSLNKRRRQWKSTFRDISAKHFE